MLVHSPAYLLKFICNPESVLLLLSWPFAVMHRATKSLSRPVCTCPAVVPQRDSLTSCFSARAINKCPFHALLSVTFFTFLCFPLVMLVFQMALKCSADMLSHVFQAQADCGAPYGESRCEISLVQASVVVLLVASSIKSLISIKPGVLKQKHT